MSEPGLKPMVVSLSGDRRLVRLSIGEWSTAFPAERLPDWLRLYRQLRDRKGGRYAKFYAADVSALEAVARELREKA